MHRIKYRNAPFFVEFAGLFIDGTPGLRLLDASGNLWTRLTVCLEHSRIAPDECIIKNWSENKGVLPALIDAGIVSEPVREIKTGFVNAQVCKLLVFQEELASRRREYFEEMERESD